MQHPILALIGTVHHYNSAIDHFERYEVGSGGDHLEKSIQETRRALKKVGPCDEDTPVFFSNLGVLLGYKYTITKAPRTLEESIEAARSSVEATPITDSCRAARLGNLGLRLGDRYCLKRTKSDLEEAFQLTTEAIESMPKGHQALPFCLSGLALRLGDWYDMTNNVAYLDEAIENMRKAVGHSSREIRNMERWLNNLGVWLGMRYSRIGNMVDLDESIDVLKRGIHTTSDRSPNLSLRLNNLANRLNHRYRATGVIDDLDKAIQYADKAVQVTPDGDAQKVKWLNNLSLQLRDRYERTQAMEFLEKSIQAIEKATELSEKAYLEHPGHPEVGTCWENLGLCLRMRYERSGEMEDLEKAICLIRKALTTADTVVLKARSSGNLGSLLYSYYLKTNTEKDLYDSIQATRNAIQLIPRGHTNRARWLFNLSLQLGSRYSNEMTIANLEEVIKTAEEAIDAMPDGHPDLARLRLNLGHSLLHRHAGNDVEEAIRYYQFALNQRNALTITRIQAGAAILKNCSDPEQAYRASVIAVGLIPSLTSRSLDNSDKQHTLRQVVGLASDAAAAALKANRKPLVALELLELGRGVMGTSLEEMRADVHELKEKHPEVAKRLASLREELDAPITSESALFEDSDSLVQAQISRRYEAGKELDQLMSEIRTLDGFRDFLAAPMESDMKAAANLGPIVLVNIGEDRSDAFLVESDRISALALDNLHKAEMVKWGYEQHLENPDLLEWLWDTIADPVLEALGFTQPPSTEVWPRIWWIPTGPLSKFLLHAAGNHSETSKSVLDRVISSYSPSIKAMVYGYGRPHDQHSISGKAILVGMEHTPKLESLHNVKDEMKAVKDICHSISLEVVEPERRKTAVAAHLRDCKAFHFAGHGHTNAVDPLSSFLYLQDWEDVKFRVSDLLYMNLRERSPFLAYLSACGTGQLKGEDFVDESIHLISAFQLAGFRHVIGTLWPVDDETCVDVARIVYGWMRDNGMTDKSVSRGLHEAARELRTTWQVQNQMRSASTRKAQSDEKPLLNWVPFIHFGI